MNAWSAMSIVLGTHIYLLHCAGISPLENIKEEICGSLGNIKSSGSQTCSTTDWQWQLQSCLRWGASFTWTPHALCAASQGSPDGASPHHAHAAVQTDKMATLSVTFWDSCSTGPLPPDYVLNLKISCPWDLQGISYTGSCCSVEELPQYLQQTGEDVCTTDGTPTTFWGFAASGMFCLLNKSHILSHRAYMNSQPHWIMQISPHAVPFLPDRSPCLWIANVFHRSSHRKRN